MFSYSLKFVYRETKGSAHQENNLIVNTDDPNMKNACEIAMLKYLTKHNYFSGKLIEMKEI